jgi:HEAT repeat protein
VAQLDRFAAWDPGFLASILAAIGPSVSPLLLDVLSDESSSVRVRQVAARTLLKLNYLPAGSVAASVAEQATDPDLVSACLRLLAVVGHNGHLPAIRLLADSPDEVVRQQAVRALGSLEEPARLPRLLPYLHDESPWVAMEAARALAQFGDGRLLSSAAAGSGRVAVIAGQALLEARG